MESEFQLLDRPMPPRFVQALFEGRVGPFVSLEDCQWAGIHWSVNKPFIETGKSAGHTAFWRLYSLVMNHPALKNQLQNYNFGNDLQPATAMLLIHLKKNAAYAAEYGAGLRFLRKQHDLPDPGTVPPYVLNVAQFNELVDRIKSQMDVWQPKNSFVLAEAENHHITRIQKWQERHWDIVQQEAE